MVGLSSTALGSDPLPTSLSRDISASHWKPPQRCRSTGLKSQRNFFFRKFLFLSLFFSAFICCCLLGFFKNCFRLLFVSVNTGFSFFGLFCSVVFLNPFLLFCLLHQFPEAWVSILCSLATLLFFLSCLYFSPFKFSPLTVKLLC